MMSIIAGNTHHFKEKAKKIIENPQLKPKIEYKNAKYDKKLSERKKKRAAILGKTARIAAEYYQEKEKKHSETEKEARRKVDDFKARRDIAAVQREADAAHYDEEQANELTGRCSSGRNVHAAVPIGNGVGIAIPGDHQVMYKQKLVHVHNRDQRTQKEKEYYERKAKAEAETAELLAREKKAQTELAELEAELKKLQILELVKKSRRPEPSNHIRVWTGTDDNASESSLESTAGFPNE